MSTRSATTQIDAQILGIKTTPTARNATPRINIKPPCPPEKLLKNPKTRDVIINSKPQINIKIFTFIFPKILTSKKSH